MTTKHFADVDGNYIGGFSDGAVPPVGSIETPEPPTAWHLWDGSEWVPNPEALATQARNQRNALLAATDWMALSDVTMSPEWAAYRQALRDVPDQVGFPENVDWPVKPE